MSVNSPLIWVGGKSSWADWLASLLPPHETYVEVFGGGGSLLLAKATSRIEVYNDLDGDLVNLFRVLRDDADAFAKMWRWTVSSREEFDSFWSVNSTELPPLERAYRYLYLNRAGFSGHMRRPAWTVKNTNNLAAWVESAEKWTSELHKRLKNVYLENSDFRKLIPQYDGRKSDGGTVFFIDQPYHVPDPAYVHWFTEQDHVDLANVMRSVKSKWLMTVNDDEFNRQLYRDFNIMTKPKTYTVSKVDGGREFGELIISNYPLPEQKQARLF